MRAAIYARVSTGRQAEGELSIPDQVRQCSAYCERHGYTLARVFEERGASATTDNRPEFQAMIAEALAVHHPFDVIIVHSQSRFARNIEHLVSYRRKLEKARVSLISITQDLGGGDAADLALNVMGLMDEYQSKETGKHVARSMLENARQGFWNGARPPFGYRTYVAERRGGKDKKKIEIEPRERETVELIFRLYAFGDGCSGPLGIKAVANYLNARGIKTRDGNAFRIQTLQKILRNAAYIGEHFFNMRDSRNQTIRPKEEWIPFETPRLVDEALFYAVQDRLDNHHPLKTAPLRIQTGKSGAYRYYKCSKKADHGMTVCAGCSVRMETLDEVVLEALADKVLAPKRLQSVLPQLVARERGRRTDFAARLRELEGEKRRHRRASTI